MVIWRPKGIGIGWSALAGAAVALATGVVDTRDISTVWGIVWNATFTFVAVILISLILDAAGFFRWAALHIARTARGNGRMLFVLVVLLGAMVASVFANDGAALILTPIVLEMLLALGYSPQASLAFVMATGFVADSTSLPLVVSNLVNIVSADYFHVSFARFAEVMIPVDIVSILASLAVLWLYFHRSIPREYALEELDAPRDAISDPLTFRIGWAVLLIVLAGYFAAGRVGIPISAVAGLGAVVLAGVAGRWWHIQIPPALGRPAKAKSARGAEHTQGSRIDVAPIVRSAPWQIVLFSLGMYLVVFGLARAGLTDVVATGLGHLAPHGSSVVALATGYGTAALASVMNNMPSVLVGALGIHASHVAANPRETMIFANVIGNDLGPKLTPIGSLATLLWLHVIERRGVHIGWAQYMRTGIVLTLPVLALTLLALAGWLHVIG